MAATPIWLLTYRSSFGKWKGTRKSSHFSFVTQNKFKRNACSLFFRILCPGGTLVVLLSPQLSCLLKKLLTQEPAEPALEQKAEPQAVAASCLSSSSPPDQKLHSQDRRPAAGLQQRQPPRRSSLKHQATFRVSLGAIDGLIQKYVKT